MCEKKPQQEYLKDSQLSEVPGQICGGMDGEGSPGRSPGTQLCCDSQENVGNVVVRLRKQS